MTVLPIADFGKRASVTGKWMIFSYFDILFDKVLLLCDCGGSSLKIWSVIG